MTTDGGELTPGRKKIPGQKQQLSTTGCCGPTHAQHCTDRSAQSPRLKSVLRSEANSTVFWHSSLPTLRQGGYQSVTQYTPSNNKNKTEYNNKQTHQVNTQWSEITLAVVSKQKKIKQQTNTPNQHKRELTSARNTQHKYNKDLSRPR